MVIVTIRIIVRVRMIVIVWFEWHDFWLDDNHYLSSLVNRQALAQSDFRADRPTEIAGKCFDRATDADAG